MGRSRMNCMKITLHLLALCLLLSITTKVSGKPNPRHFLIETVEQAKAKNNDDYQNSQTMTGNFISGGNVHQSQSNGGGLGGSSQNSQSMTGNSIHGASVNQDQSNGGGSVTPKAWEATTSLVVRLIRGKAMVAVWVAVPVTPKAWEATTSLVVRLIRGKAMVAVWVAVP